LTVLFTYALAAWSDRPPNRLAGTFGETKGPASVVPSTGAFLYSLPFELPPKRGNAQPNLTLTYESGSRAGEAGLGSALNIPVIERTPLSGSPRNIDDGFWNTKVDFVQWTSSHIYLRCRGSSSLPVKRSCWRNAFMGSGISPLQISSRKIIRKVPLFFWNPINNRWIVQ
jgi:hypothetical protein